MKDFEYVEKLISISENIFKKTFNLTEIKAEIIKDSKLSDFQLLMAGKEADIKVHATDSARSAWVYSPWKHNGKEYCGLQYKGVGFYGKEIEYVPEYHVAVGGLAIEQAVSEFRNSKIALDNKVDCQLPIACYKTDLKLGGYYCGVFVRSFQSPLRLATFQHWGYLSDYLKMRYGKADEKSLEKYFSFIGEKTGENLKNLFEAGMIHTSLQQGNITSEAEVADFDEAQSKKEQGVWFSKDEEDRRSAIEMNLYPMSRFFSDLSLENSDLVDNKQVGWDLFEKIYVSNFSKGLIGEEVEFTTIDEFVLKLIKFI